MITRADLALKLDIMAWEPGFWLTSSPGIMTNAAILHAFATEDWNNDKDHLTP